MLNSTFFITTLVFYIITTIIITNGVVVNVVDGKIFQSRQRQSSKEDVINPEAAGDDVDEPVEINDEEYEDDDDDDDLDEQTLLDTFGDAAKQYLTKHVIPKTDAACRWSWRYGRCEPYCSCHFRPLWGDYHLGRSCRTRIDENENENENDDDDTTTNTCSSSSSGPENPYSRTVERVLTRSKIISEVIKKKLPKKKKKSRQSSQMEQESKETSDDNQEEEQQQHSEKKENTTPTTSTSRGGVFDYFKR